MLKMTRVIPNYWHLDFFRFRHFLLFFFFHQSISHWILSWHQGAEIKPNDAKRCQKAKRISMLIPVFHEIDEKRNHESTNSAKIQSKTISQRTNYSRKWLRRICYQYREEDAICKFNQRYKQNHGQYWNTRGTTKLKIIAILLNVRKP